MVRYSKLEYGINRGDKMIEQDEFNQPIKLPDGYECEYCGHIFKTEKGKNGCCTEEKLDNLMSESP